MAVNRGRARQDPKVCCHSAAVLARNPAGKALLKSGVPRHRADPGSLKHTLDGSSP